MNMINKTYRFRLYPSKEQEGLLSQHFGHTRFIYNYFLSERIKQYESTKKTDNYNAQASKLTQLKKQEDKSWLNQVNSQSLQFSLKSLEIAYQNYFNKKAKYPRFKSRKHKNSFTVPQSGKMEGDRIIIPKFREGIKVKLHREVKGKIGKMTITKSPTGKYYVSIFTEQETAYLPKTGRQVGVDLGLKHLAITSDGIKYDNNKYTKKYAKKLKSAQKYLSRKQKGSNGFEKQKLKVAKIHEKIANSRLDNLHKVSRKLVESYDLISVENLNVKGMVKNRRLSKHIADASWGTFVNLLQYKCDWYGKEIVKIDRFYPSSKTCSDCGDVNEQLTLSDREWTCTSCGTIHDRDINASINILSQGLIVKSAGTVDYTDGDSNKPSFEKHKSKKSETQPIGYAVGG